MPDGDRFGVELRRLVGEGKQVRNVSITTKRVESNDEYWTIVGVASTPRVDRMGDVLDPLGAEFSLPVKLLLNHQSGQVIGNVVAAKKTRRGVEFEARIPKVKEDGIVKDRITEAVHSLQYGLIDSTSVGFNPKWDRVELIRDDNGDVTGLHFLAWEWLELSLVPIPANPDAKVTQFKALATAMAKAVPGRSSPSRASASPGGAAPPPPSIPKGRSMKTIHEQVLELRETRTTALARMQELSDLTKAEDFAGFNEEQQTEFNALKRQIDQIDVELAVKERQAVEIRSAVPVDKAAGNGGRAPMGYVRKQDPDDKFKGQSGTRMVIAKALAAMYLREGIYMKPSEIAEKRWGKTNPMLVQVIRANEVGEAGSGAEWGHELVTADNRYTGDFIDYIYSRTVYDRLPLRRVPANIQVKGQDGAFVGYWVGESKAIPVSAGDYSNTTLTPLKVAALAVVANEWLRDASPDGEMLVRDGLSNAHEQRIDTTFLSTAAAVSGVSPAGILNGVSAKASNGPDAQSVMTDWRALMADFITAKQTRGLQVVTTPSVAEGIGSMQNALGQDAFPGINADGGTFRGRPVLTGDNVGTGDFILLNPAEIWRIGDLGVQISVSQEATIEMSSAPAAEADTPTGQTENPVSMFQTESTAIKLVRPINFAKRRSTAVSYIGDAAYGAEVS